MTTTSVYILRIGSEEAEALAAQVAPGRAEAVEFVRLTTLAPIDTHGFDETSVGAVIGLSTLGVSVASSNQPRAPVVLVPWTNVVSLTFGPTTPPEKPEPSPATGSGRPRRGQW